MQASEARENAETELGAVNPVRVAKKTAAVILLRRLGMRNGAPAQVHVD